MRIELMGAMIGEFAALGDRLAATIAAPRVCKAIPIWAAAKKPYRE
jgi:hypothetical protein